jgi:hypothetical protein
LFDAYQTATGNLSNIVSTITISIVCSPLWTF